MLHTGTPRYVWIYSTDMTNWTFAGTNILRGCLAPPVTGALQTVAYYNEPAYELDQSCTASADRRTRTGSNTLGAVMTGATNLIVHGMAEYGGSLYMTAVTAGAHASRSVGLYRWSGITGMVAVATGIVTWARDGIISEPALTFAGSTCVIVTASAYTSVVKTAIMSTATDPFTSWSNTPLAINLNGAQMTTDGQGRIWMVGRHQDQPGPTADKPCVTALWRVLPVERTVLLKATMENGWQTGDNISKCGYGFPVAIGQNVWCVYYSGYKVYSTRVDVTGEP
jgi:hypothetical protein